MSCWNDFIRSEFFVKQLRPDVLEPTVWIKLNISAIQVFVASNLEEGLGDILALMNKNILNLPYSDGPRSRTKLDSATFVFFPSRKGRCPIDDLAHPQFLSATDDVGDWLAFFTNGGIMMDKIVIGPLDRSNRLDQFRVVFGGERFDIGVIHQQRLACKVQPC